MSLFLTPFIETWNVSQEVSTNGGLGFVLGVFYILYATITLNLLIAIVTDVYPKARMDSDSLWEEIITAGIEDTLRAAVHRDHSVKEALNIEVWSSQEVLEGRDGIKHWVPPEPGSVEREQVQRIAALESQLFTMTKLLERLVHDRGLSTEV
mmetsp:Transcript_11063/g.31433  ORF Transcript_11063/g.31433 Transcript_11063/m.31433 type:complete len:152 (+) Transcript_11063:3-458(+)